MADRSVVIKLPRLDYEQLEYVAEQQDRIAEQQAAHVIKRWLRRAGPPLRGPESAAKHADDRQPAEASAS